MTSKTGQSLCMNAVFQNGALLPVLRKWLPDDDARAALDGVMRRQMRSGATRSTARTSTIHRAAASLPDGAGAQSLIADLRTGSRRGVAMAMLKQGNGVKDAFVIPCASATEQKQMLARILVEIETVDVAPDMLAAMLARGLGEGLALDLMPAPGLVDLAEVLGPDALAPAAFCRAISRPWRSRRCSRHRRTGWALLGGIEFPSEGVVESLRGSSGQPGANDAAADPETVARALAALDEDGLKD
jgi:hypothetical protein